MIKAMNEVQALQDIAPKRRRSAEYLLFALIGLVMLAIGAVLVEMVYPEAAKDFVLALSNYL